MFEGSVVRLRKIFALRIVSPRVPQSENRHIAANLRRTKYYFVSFNCAWCPALLWTSLLHGVQVRKDRGDLLLERRIDADFTADMLLAGNKTKRENWTRYGIWNKNW